VEVLEAINGFFAELRKRSVLDRGTKSVPPATARWY
jgi:hypothetical protein